MLSKRNLGIALMAVIAGFLIYQGGKYVHALALSGPTLANISGSTSDTQNCPSCDPDRDGLTNSEEVLWNSDPFNADTDSDGFKDGEEVASGHNPLVPGPDDLIKSDNLTQQLSDLTTSGLISGDLNPASDSYQQILSDITSSVADSGKYLFNKKVDPASLTIIISNNETDLTYIKAVSPVIKSLSNILNDHIKRLASDLNSIGSQGFSSSINIFYSGQANTLNDLLNQTLSMPVPRTFAPANAELASIIQQMKAIDDAVSQGDKDVVKATLALEAIGDLPDKLINFVNDYTHAIKSENIDLGSLNNL